MPTRFAQLLMDGEFEKFKAEVSQVDVDDIYRSSELYPGYQEDVENRPRLLDWMFQQSIQQDLIIHLLHHLNDWIINEYVNRRDYDMIRALIPLATHKQICWRQNARGPMLLTRLIERNAPDDVIALMIQYCPANLLTERDQYDALVSCRIHTNSHVMLTFLLEHGMDPNARNILNQTPLFHANSYDYAKTLIDHGANVDLIDKNTNNVLQITCSPSYEAVSRRQIEYLLDHSTNARGMINHSNRILVYFVTHNWVDVTELLLQRGANMSMGGRSIWACSPLLDKMYALIARWCVGQGLLGTERMFRNATIPHEIGQFGLRISEFLGCSRISCNF